MQKILIIGANGFLGSYLQQIYKSSSQLKQHIQIITSDLENTNIDPNFQFQKIDITDKDMVSRVMEKVEPDCVLLTAAMTNVDLCETEMELAKKINTIGPQNVAESCARLGAKLLFLSTDFVFDGNLPIGNSYSETDTPNPQSYYAKTKFWAEQSIINMDIDFLICRTAVLYGWNPQKLNYITWILQNLENDREISIVTSQINNPTYAYNLAELLYDLIEIDAGGIYHTAGSTPLNRYQMALEVANVFDLDESLIKPISSFDQLAERPKNAALDVSKLQNTISPELRIFSLKKGLQHMKFTKAD